MPNYKLYPLPENMSAIPIGNGMSGAPELIARNYALLDHGRRQQQFEESQRRMREQIGSFGSGAKQVVRAFLDPIAKAARGDTPSGVMESADYATSLIPGGSAAKAAIVPLAKGIGGLGLGALGHTVFHGSPHKFDMFDISKIGTGEGAQVYGHGLYFAENPAVAKSYADMGKRHAIQPDSAHIKAASNFMENGMDAAQGLKSAYPDITNAQLEAAITEAKGGFSPNIYKVDIPDEFLPRMLDWDAPDWQQPKALQDLGRELGLQEWTGTDLMLALKQRYRQAGAVDPEQMAAKELKSLGIPGIKYYDQGSRGLGEGTRNYVMFGDEGLKILERK